MGTTVFATVSTPGPPGPAGPPGYAPQYIVAPGAPSNTAGNNGDMYINSTTGDVYGPKVAGAWGSIVCNIKGSTGAPGPTGAPGYSPQYIVQPGPPSSALGNNLDMYINATTSDVYGPKVAGAWGAIVCNIKGATGAQGPPGVGYTAKGAWSASITYLQGDQVSYLSALYIGLQGGNLNNVPSTSPTWWEPVGSGGAAQTPWLSNIDGGGNQLGNVSRIGIVTITPGAPIHVSSASGNVSAILQAPATFAPYVDMRRGTQIWWFGPGISGDNSINLYNQTAATYPLTIQAGGNCGIGTPTPNSRFSVIPAANGTSVATCNQITIGEVTNNANYSLALGYGTIASATVGVIQVIGGGASCPLLLNPNGGNVGVGLVAPATTLHVAADVYRQLYLTSSSDPTNKQMRIGYDLSNNTGVVEMLIAGAGGPLFLNPTGGGVAIGTTTPPAFQLSLGPAVTARKLAVYDGGSDFFGFGVAASTLRYDSGSGSDHVFYTASGVERVRFTTVGSVGIGINAPYSALSVVRGSPNTAASANQITIGEASLNPQYYFQLGFGTIGAAGWSGVVQAIAGGAGAPLFLNPSGGKVGVGNSAPGWALDVTGDINCSGAFRVNGTPIATGGGLTVMSVVTGSRVIGPTYVNSTGKPMFVSVTASVATSQQLSAFSDTAATPVTNVSLFFNSWNQGANTTMTFWVMPGHNYRTAASGTSVLNVWIEYT